MLGIKFPRYSFKKGGAVHGSNASRRPPTLVHPGERPQHLVGAQLLYFLAARFYFVRTLVFIAVGDDQRGPILGPVRA